MPSIHFLDYTNPPQMGLLLSFKVLQLEIRGKKNYRFSVIISCLLYCLHA
jgi:hypothetical protein